MEYGSMSSRPPPSARDLLGDIDSLVKSLRRTVEKDGRNVSSEVMKLLKEAKDSLRKADEELFDFDDVVETAEVSFLRDFHISNKASLYFLLVGFVHVCTIDHISCCRNVFCRGATRMHFHLIYADTNPKVDFEISQ